MKERKKENETNLEREVYTAIIRYKDKDVNRIKKKKLLFDNVHISLRQ